MRNFQKKQGWRNAAESKPVLIILGVIILFFAWNVFGFWTKMEETSKNKKIAEAKVAELEQQKEKLATDISNLQTDAGKEKFFRENLGLAKQGEDMIVVVDDKNQSAPSEKPSWWGYIKNWFK